MDVIRSGGCCDFFRANFGLTNIEFKLKGFELRLGFKVYECNVSAIGYMLSFRHNLANVLEFGKVL